MRGRGRRVATMWALANAEGLSKPTLRIHAALRAFVSLFLPRDMRLGGADDPAPRQRDDDEDGDTEEDTEEDGVGRKPSKRHAAVVKAQSFATCHHHVGWQSSGRGARLSPRARPRVTALALDFARPQPPRRCPLVCPWPTPAGHHDVPGRCELGPVAINLLRSSRHTAAHSR